MKKYSNDNIFLNSMNDLTRQAYSQDNRNKPLNNSSTITRFESDLFITKKEEFESKLKVEPSPASSEFPENAQVCKKCSVKAVILMDGCMTCLNCGDSKCG